MSPSLKETLKSVESTESHVRVIARAGTGKTTTMIEGLKIIKGLEPSIIPSEQQAAIWEEMKLSASAKKIAFTAFNKSIAKELQSKVPAGVDAMTMHSLGFKAVQNAFGKVKPDSWRTVNLICKALGRDYKELRRNDPLLLNATQKLISLVKQNLATEDNYMELVVHYEVPVKDVNLSKLFELTTEVIELSKDVATDRSCHFDDMIWLPVALGLPMAKYDLLIVDEAQDLNKCQQQLALKAGKRLIFVGDEKQAIYGFAGADSESLDRLETILSDTEQGCTSLPLTMTRRCGRAIVEEAQKLVPDFEYHESNGEGLVQDIPFEGENSYLSIVAQGDMILSRVNAPLVRECFRFLKQGKKAQIQGRDIGKNLITLIHNLVKQPKQPYCSADDSIHTTELIEALESWLSKEVSLEEAKKNPSENRIIMMQDKRDCIVCLASQTETVGEVVAKLEEMFSDKEAPGIRLSSIHKAKGLEADRVFFINTKDAPCPHPMAKSSWAQEQEYNLFYVAVTRAIKELYFVK